MAVRLGDKRVKPSDCASAVVAMTSATMAASRHK
jgi:hypothetical protein